MCDLAVDLPRLSQLHGRDLRSAIVARPRIKSLIADDAVTVIDDRLSIGDGAEFLVRSIASAFDEPIVARHERHRLRRGSPEAPPNLRPAAGTACGPLEGHGFSNRTLART